jgi:penicillin amidase
LLLLVLPLTIAAGAWSAAGRQANADRFTTLARESLSEITGDLVLPGLTATVEVIRDTWGVPHIYAQNTVDLFMAQGYVMAQDRLWQMEMWRRDREGRLAQILGPQAVARDRTARLLKYRGPMDDREWTSYHPDGKRIFTAFAAGVNAYIASHATALPVEFTVTGITPDPWTAETCVLRTATLGDTAAELQLARDVARLGLEQANRQRAPDPWDDLTVPDGLDVSTIDDAVGGRGGGGGGGAIRPALVEPYRSWIGAGSTRPARSSPSQDSSDLQDSPDARDPPGSNNWVVSGRLSATGKPIVANDPHRTNTNPSLRYIVHLNAPGWNVIGSGEPPFVGVAIGHNDRLAWGLTIVGTDQEDTYVEEVNPSNPNEVKWHDGWEAIKVVREEIAVKGEAPRVVELKFTRHGPVFYEDAARHRVYALRSALLEPGAAAYLGGLRLDQAKTCREFLDAAMYWKAPTENLICGDVDGNIAWQASALTPNRKGWVGRLPVPGDGRYEWDGFRAELPRELNPDRGFVATANNNINTAGYWPPVVFKTTTGAAFERITRLLQMVRPDRKYSVDDMRAMQLDALSLRAQSELPLFKGWASSSPTVERARQMIASWDAVQSRESAAAALYSAWRTGSTAEERDAGRSIEVRKPLIEAGLGRAIERLVAGQGADWSTWRWGRMHTQAYPHPFVPVFDLPAIERRGGSGTVAADGATYREILDVASWDRSIVTNVPGQSGQPESPYYSSLLPLFGSDTYFPLDFSRPAVDKDAARRLRLKPR